MNPLPPLRTVRTVTSAPPQAIDSTPAPTVTPPPAAPRLVEPSLHNPNIPKPLRDLLQDLVAIGLADSASVKRFLAESLDRLPNFIHRERAAQALVHARLITGYQRDRLLAGNTFGLILGPYRVLDRLGGGSVGVVFLAEHIHLHRRVAIKVLPVDNELPAEIRERFHTEMRILASLAHPNVVSAFDAGILDSNEPGSPSLHYLVLELVSGGDIEQYVVQNGPATIEQGCEWARQAASGLQAAHDRHLIHRDLKPSNLLLTETLQVKVVDFGLARHFASTLTQPKSLVGSLEFMSPEQCLEPSHVGPPADIYGLGACLFWTITGHLPISNDGSIEGMVQALRSDRPRRLKEFLPDVPPALDAFMARMLARDPAHRPTALEVMIQLSEHTGVLMPPGESPNAPKASSEVIKLRQTVRQLEGRLKAKENDAGRAEEAVLFALAKMAESHDEETLGHVRRMQEYVRLLTTALASHQEWPELRDSQYVAELIRCVPLHDIGKIGLPDELMSKPGALSHDERDLAETHPQIGCDILAALADAHGQSLRFLGMARAIIRHHHERWDGGGYPDRLAGINIPPAARLVALADTYDALRRVRPQRPAMPHSAAVATILQETGGRFDPTVVDAFKACERRFDEVFLTIPN